VHPGVSILVLQCLPDILFGTSQWLVCLVQDLYVMRLMFKFCDEPVRILMLETRIQFSRSKSVYYLDGNKAALSSISEDICTLAYKKPKGTLYRLASRHLFSRVYKL
jgi:hypothetical protein